MAVGRPFEMRLWGLVLCFPLWADTWCSVCVPPPLPSQATGGARRPRRTRPSDRSTSATSPCPPASPSRRSSPWRSPGGNRRPSGTPSVSWPRSGSDGGRARERGALRASSGREPGTGRTWAEELLRGASDEEADLALPAGFRDLAASSGGKGAQDARL